MIKMLEKAAASLSILAVMGAITLLSATQVTAEENSELIVKMERVKGGVHSLEFRADGRTLLSGTTSGRAQVWDAQNGESLQRISRSRRNMHAAAYSPDGAFVVTAGERGTVRVWEAATGKEVRSLEGAEGSQRMVAVSPDGRHIAAGGANHVLTIWRANEMRALHSITAHERPITDVAFSPDGEFICTVSEDGSMRVWETITGYLVFSVKLPGPLNACEFSPNGQLVAVAGDDAKVVELKTSTVIQTLKGHEGQVMSLAFSPNGSYLATGGADRKVRLFSMTTGRIVESLNSQDGMITSLAFNPEGTILATGSHRYRAPAEEGGDLAGEDSIWVWDISEVYTDGRIARYVERQLYHWQMKGEFEKQSDHERRMSAIDVQAGKYFAKAFRMYADEVKEDASLSNYNSETETYMVTIPAIGTFPVRVAVEKAETFKKRFHEMVYRNFVVEPTIRVPHKSTWTLKRVELYLPSAKQSFFYENMMPVERG